MDLRHKATRIDLFNFRSPQMRAFHVSWSAFFLCFFAWFGIAPLMTVVRDELHLTKSQVGWCIIASVAITIVARLLMGWLCDRIGPRLAYTWLLVFGSLPVMGIGFAYDFSSFLIFRLLIGAIGASFVITQYHTSVMFAPNCVGTANATSAGWGNLGGGVTQMAMPLLFALFVSVLGFSPAVSWRAAMVVVGLMCMAAGVAYYYLTQDAPEGNYRDLRAAGKLPDGKKAAGAFWTACKDHRVWALAAIYASCFGIELTIDNIAAMYFTDYFDLSLMGAGLVASVFGMMNIIARTLGGMVSDRFGNRWGLKGRVVWLFAVLFCEGLALMLFSQLRVLVLAIPTMILFGLFVKMSNGATYSVVPFVNKRALGGVAGIVGAGGNVGAVAAGFLFKGSLPWPTALLILGAAVTTVSFLTLIVRFSPEAETEAADAVAAALAHRRAAATEPALEPAMSP